MSFNLFYIFFILAINQIICSPNCEEGKNNCTKCDYISQLCVKCNRDIFVPDENGGCKGSNKCILGQNYCQECKEGEKLCKICEEGYFPDENGGCSYTDNCEISSMGECIKCKENYILIGENTYLFEGFILCKSIDSEDFKNCEEINIRKGKCSKCKEGFYLNRIDSRCIETDYCLESAFGNCLKCKYDYYLDKMDNTCKKQEGLLSNCKETIDGKTCDLCNEGYYFDEERKCIYINYCDKEGENGNCVKCKSGYYLSSSSYRTSCSKEENCYEADKDTGLCLQCNKNYYIDLKDGKCKSNLENNEYKYCKSVREQCINCINGFFLGEDLKCSETVGCFNSINGICNECSEGFYLGLDNKCSLIENCIYSLNEYNCNECKDGYYYNENNKSCILAENEFKNCKFVKYNSNHCSLCKNNFYLNRTDSLCYSNENYGDFYKCSFTDISGKICTSCVENYYYSYTNHICSNFEGCELQEDESACIKCEFDYCLDVKNGNCVINYEVFDKDKKFYYGCIRTNEDGTACEICNNNLTLDNGLCVDKYHCEEEIDGICKKCVNYLDEDYYHCLNSDFGCVEMYTEHCLECNNIYNFDICTKCMDGYQLDEYDECVEIEK